MNKRLSVMCLIQFIKKLFIKKNKKKTDVMKFKFTSIVK